MPSKETCRRQASEPSSTRAWTCIQALREKRSCKSLFEPSDLQRESPSSNLREDYHHLGENLSSHHITQNQAVDRAREISRLVRSNAVRNRNPPHKSIRRDSITGSWSESEDDSSLYSGPCYSTSSGDIDRHIRYPVQDQHWRPSDKELPLALRQLIDDDDTCDLIGRYIVLWLRYARNSRILDLRNEHGHPLHSDVQLGDIHDVPHPGKPIQRGFADSPELIAPSNMRYPLLGKSVRFLLDEMTDEELDEKFLEQDEATGEARLVNVGARHIARVVETRSPPKSVDRDVGHVSDVSPWL